MFAPVLRAKWPGRPVSAYWELAYREEVDASQVVQDAATLKGAGYRIDAGELAEKTGYELADAAEAAAPDTRHGSIGSDGKLDPVVRNREEGSRRGAETRSVFAALMEQWEVTLATAMAEGAAEEILNAGTSEGARKGWETRRRNGWLPTNRPKGTGQPKKRKRRNTIEEVLDAAFVDVDNRDFVHYQKLDSQASDDIEKRTGEMKDLTGWERSLNADSVNKVLSKHISDKRPVEEEDFRYLSQYLDAPDSQEWSLNGNKWRLKSWVTTAGGELWVIEEEETNNRRLSFVTMYRP